MSLKKTLIIAGTVIAIGAGSLATIGLAKAADDQAKPTLIDKLVEKFNLNKDEVQAVFDEFKDERQAEHRAKLEERLQKAVDEGKLTAEQRDAILSKIDEAKTFMESLKDMSPDERKEAIKSHHEELKTWAEENNIPEDFRFFMMLKHDHRGPGHRGMREFGPDGFGSGPMEFDRPMDVPSEVGAQEI